MSFVHELRSWVSQLRKPRSFGQRGEDAAAHFLQRLGYVIVARGQRDAVGELDLVAVDNRTIVFVEVKTRRSHQKGHPAEAVDEEKQRRLVRLALHYARRHDLLECSLRFDVVAVTWEDDSQAPEIEHFKNAFEPSDSGQLFS